MPLKPSLNDVPARTFRRLTHGATFAFAILALGMSETVQAQSSVSAMARAEAQRRASRVNQAGEAVQKGYRLLDERKPEEALGVFKAAYEDLPDIPLAREHRLAARNGYVAAGCLHAQALAGQGDVAGARKLIDELLAPSVAPNDSRALELRRRFADPDRYPPALTKEHAANVQAVQALLIKANSFLGLGDLDKAISTFQDVLRIDPYNSAARRGMETAEREKQRYYQTAYDHQRAKMLAGVDKTWEYPVPLSAQDVSAMFGAGMSGKRLEGAARINDKLKSLVFPKVEFAGATLGEVVEMLRVRSCDLDSEGSGVSFVLNVPDEARNKPISLTLFNVPMEEVLRYVSEMCGVAYRVEEHAVTFVSISDRNNTMVSRSFRVPPDFIQNAPVNTQTGAGAPDPFAKPPPGGGGLTIRRMGAREALEARGVNFPEGASASFNAATSLLVVRNTVANMDIVEDLVAQAANSAPKQVTISVRMLEVNQKNLEELGYDWLLGGAGMNGNSVFLGGGSQGSGNTYSATNFPFVNQSTIPSLTPALPPTVVSTAIGGVLPPGSANAGGGGPITSGLRTGTFAIPEHAIDALLDQGVVNTAQTVAPGVLSLAGVFTDPQFQAVLRGLSQKKGIDINATPSVTTKSGQKATVEITREFIYPTEFDPPQVVTTRPPALPLATPTTPTTFEMRKTGVLLDVEPVIGEDGGTVELTLSPELTDFEGFVNYGSPIQMPTGLNFITLVVGGVTQVIPFQSPDRVITPNKILQPIFKSNKVTTAVKVWDGATIVLGGAKVQTRTMVNDKLPILGDVPFVGRFFRSDTKQVDTKNIIIFVTVNVIDPSGRKINRQTTAEAR